MTKNEPTTTPKRPRVEVLMERNASKTSSKPILPKIICKCDSRYLNKTKTEDRNCMSKKQYLKVLATPKPKPPPPITEYYDEIPKKPLPKGPCPPRIEELARPNAAHVLNTWQKYHDVLPPERMEKLQTLLYDAACMHPKQALYHFKRIRTRLRKQKAAKKKKIKPVISQTQLTLMQREEMLTAKAIMEHFQAKPLASVKYRHMCISDILLERMCKHHLLKKPKRKTKSFYEKGLIEIADHIAVWFEKLVEEIQICEKREAEEAGIFSSEEEMSVVEEEEGESEYSIESVGIQAAEALLAEELLQRLIKILESGEPEPRDALIDPEALPRVTYDDVLQKLKEFDYTGEPMPSERGDRLDAAMADWAMKNDPENYDQELRDFTTYVAGVLAHQLYAEMGEGEEEEEEEFLSEGEYPPYDAMGPKTESEPMTEDMDTSLADVSGEAGYDHLRGVDEEPVEPAFATDTEKTPTMLGGDEDADNADVTDDIMEVSSLEGEEAAAKEGEMLLDEGFTPEQEAGQQEAEEEAAMLRELEEAAKGTSEGVVISPEEAEEAAARKEAEEAAARMEAEELAAAERGEGLTPEEKAALLAAEGEEEEEELRGLTEEQKSAYRIAKAESKARAEAEKKEMAAVGPPGVIFGHKPSRTFEHTPDGICCVSLKIYALWLYEVAENAHNWSSWLIEVIQEVRTFTRVVKGEVKNPDGTRRVLKKDEWRTFVEKIEKMIVSWRQYSQHIGSLSERLMKTIHEKSVTCCPKCVSDNLIKDLTAANCLTDELVEAITTATYWRQWLDNMIDQTKRLTTIPVFTEGKKSLQAPQKKVCTCGAKPIRKPGGRRGPSPFAPKPHMQVHKAPQKQASSSSSDDDDEAIFEIEEIDPNKPCSSKRR